MYSSGTERSERVEEKKLNEILKVLEGISYSDWKKIQQSVEIGFDLEVKEIQKKIKLECIEVVEETVLSLFPNIKKKRSW